MLKEINSLEHPVVKHLVKLREKREYRYQNKSALLMGIKLIEDLSHTHRFKKILIEKTYQPPFCINAEQTFRVDHRILKKITALIQPEPLAAEISIPKEEELTQKNYLIILDGISDPGNLGTLLRTALALDWEGVVITPGSTDPFNDKALRAAKGATFKIPLKCGSWDEIEELFKTKKWQILSAEMKGKPVEETTFRLPVALALGNEANGLSPHIKQLGQPIAISMVNEMESLNVACAGAILMYCIKSRT